jgi:hypothetical protein
MKRDIQQVLDECVESMLNGTATLEECVSRLGNEMRAEVEPMLFAVQRVVKDADVKPNEIKKQSGKTVFMAAVDQKRWESGIEREVLLDKKIGKDHYLLLKRLAVMMGAIIALSGATVAMASESIPGNLLYPVKRAVENAKINMTPEGGNKRLLYMQAAENRMDELEKLEKDDANYAVAMQDMAESLEKATAGIAGGVDDQGNAGSNQIILQPRIQEQLNERLAEVEKRSEANIEKKLHMFTPGLKPLVERELARLNKLKNKKNTAEAEENMLPVNSQAGKINKKAGNLPGGIISATDNAATGNKGLNKKDVIKKVGGAGSTVSTGEVNGTVNNVKIRNIKARGTSSGIKDSTNNKIRQLDKSDDLKKKILKRKIRNNNTNIVSTTTTTSLNSNPIRKKKLNTNNSGGNTNKDVKPGTNNTNINANDAGNTQPTTPPSTPNTTTNQNSSSVINDKQSDASSGNTAGSSGSDNSQKTSSPSSNNSAKP